MTTTTARLGDSTVRRIGFGAGQLGTAGTRQPADRDTAVTVLRAAVEAGVDHIDTADFYGPGVVNDRIRDALYPYPENLQLVSKVGAFWVTDPGEGRLPLEPAQRPDQLRAGVEANLRRLRIDRLAAVNLRRLNRVGIPATGDQLVDLDDQLAELVALRDEGLIGGIGLSNVSLDELRQALPAGIVCVQNMYHLLDRSDEPLLRLCAAEDIAFVPFYPLGSAGFPGMRSVTANPTVIATAAALDVPPARLGLAWLLEHDPHILLIPGTRSVDHLADNLAAVDLDLGADTMATLDALFDQDH